MFERLLSEMPLTSSRGTMEVADSLRRMGVRSPQVLQGDMSQTHRDGVIRGFREGKFPVLVATDVAARGLDIPNVELIVQVGWNERFDKGCLFD